LLCSNRQGKYEKYQYSKPFTFPYEDKKPEEIQPEKNTSLDPTANHDDFMIVTQFLNRK
jgi:hypothetical protein